MKKVITFIFVFSIFNLLAPMSIKSQERVNGENYSFTKESQIVSHFTGWCYNKSTEQWVGNENCIEIFEMPSYQVGKHAQGNTTRNLQGVQIKEFSYNGETLYVFDAMVNDGVYKYPSLKEDWISMTKHYCFLISENVYKRIINPNEETVEFFFPCVEWSKNDDNELIRQLIRYRESFNKEKERSAEREIATQKAKTNNKKSKFDHYNGKSTNYFKANSFYGKQFVLKRYKDSVRFLWNASYHGEWRDLGSWGSEDPFSKRKALNSLLEVYFETPFEEWETYLKL